MNNEKESYILFKYFKGKILLKLNKTKTKIKKVLLFYPSDKIKNFQISKHKFLISFYTYDQLSKKITTKCTFSVEELILEAKNGEYSPNKVQLEEFENENEAKLFFEFIF